MKNNKKGFTLIELLVVIAIIALLSTIAVLALSASRASARDSKRIADLKSMQTAVELYGSNNAGEYPTAADWTTLQTALGSYIQQADLPGDPQLDLTVGQIYTYCVKDNATPANANNKYLLADSLEGDTVIEGDLDSTHALLVAATAYNEETDCINENGGIQTAQYNALTCEDIVGTNIAYCLGSI